MDGAARTNRLDAEMSCKHISDVVDVQRYSRVVPDDTIVRTWRGDLLLPRGMLSDGATRVIDICPEAWFAHDLLCRYPVINGHRISKWEADMLYGWILLRNGHIAGVWRPAGMLVVPGAAHVSWRMWHDQRQREIDEPEWWLTECMVPFPDYWHFPTIDTVDAVYIGS